MPLVPHFRTDLIVHVCSSYRSVLRLVHPRKLFSCGRLVHLPPRTQRSSSPRYVRLAYIHVIIKYPLVNIGALHEKKLAAPKWRRRKFSLKKKMVARWSCFCVPYSATATQVLRYWKHSTCLLLSYLLHDTRHYIVSKPKKATNADLSTWKRRLQCDV